MHPKLIKIIHGIRASKKEIFLQILLVFIIPVTLIQTGIIPLTSRVLFLALVVSTLLVVLFSFDHWKIRMFAVDIKGFKEHLVPYIIFTAILALLLVGFGEYILKYEELQRWWQHSHFLYLFFIVSLLQEIAYRGYLIPALGKLTDKTPMLIFANAVLFTFLHIIYPNPFIGLSVAFLGGIGFAVMYINYPSLSLIILSHSVLNFVAVLYGFFVIPGITY